MNRPRSLSPAVLLANSEVLVVGGTDGEGPIIGGQGDASAEIYDPSTGRWSYTASMEVPRYHATYTATALADGDVLVAGGMVLGTIDERINVTLPYAEIYHPATASWSPTGPMLLPTAYQSAVALPGGKVLVVGGVPSNHPDLAADALRSAEVYTPPASVVPPRSSATSPGTILRGALAGLAGAAVIITATAETRKPGNPGARS